MDRIVPPERLVERVGIVEKAPLEPLQIEGERRLAHRLLILGPSAGLGCHGASLAPRRSTAQGLRALALTVAPTPS